MVSKVLITIILLVAMFVLISEAHPSGEYRHFGHGEYGYRHGDFYGGYGLGALGAYELGAYELGAYSALGLGVAGVLPVAGAIVG
jgi:hypothetical protein